MFPLSVVLTLTLVASGACGKSDTNPAANQAQGPVVDSRAPASDSTDPPDVAPPDEAIAAALAPAKGDIEEMRDKRRIRMLVTFSKTNYFLDKGRQMGATAEAGRAFEDFVNDQLKTRNLRIHVIFVPV